MSRATFCWVALCALFSGLVGCNDPGRSEIFVLPSQDGSDANTDGGGSVDADDGAADGAGSTDGADGADGGVDVDVSLDDGAAQDTARDPGPDAPAGFAQIEVSVDGTSYGDAGGTWSFASALQTAVDAQVTIRNPASAASGAPLEIRSIAWRDGAGGEAEVNPYVQLIGTSGVSFPIVVGPGASESFGFVVRFTPPVGGPLDDLRDSVLVIASNARAANGSADIQEVSVTFGMPDAGACRQVTPGTYTFQNATPSKAEVQRFCLGSCPDTGLAPFTLQGVSLQSPSSEFSVLAPCQWGAAADDPRFGEPVTLPATIEAIDATDYSPVCCDVRFQPFDQGNDTNALVFSTDGDEVVVPLASNLLVGSWSLAYSHAEALDFAWATEPECRTVALLSEGPAPIAVRSHDVVYDVPDGAPTPSTFAVTAWIPATGPGDPPTEVTFPRALAAGRNLDYEVCLDPAADGGNPANAVLHIPIDTPERKVITIPLYAGPPKPSFDAAPGNSLVWVSTPVADRRTGSRTVAVYNNGNGPLTLRGAEVSGQFGPPGVVFSITAGAEPDATVVPGGVHLIELAWNAADVPSGKTDVSESLAITYVHGYTGEDTPAWFQLTLQDTAGDTPPTVALADAPSAVSGQPVTLDANQSDSGTFEFGPNAYLWYFVGRPGGSTTRLNTEADSRVSFVPDRVGTYQVEVVAYSMNGDSLLFSEPARVSVTVEAP